MEAQAPETTDPGTKPREARVSTTDIEAKVMKMADGGFRPAYNVQFAADTTSGAVAGVSVDNVGSDMGKMAPMNDALAQAYGVLVCPRSQHDLRMAPYRRVSRQDQARGTVWQRWPDSLRVTAS